MQLNTNVNQRDKELERGYKLEGWFRLVDRGESISIIGSYKLTEWFDCKVLGTYWILYQ